MLLNSQWFWNGVQGGTICFQGRCATNMLKPPHFHPKQFIRSDKKSRLIRQRTAILASYRRFQLKVSAFNPRQSQTLVTTLLGYWY